MDEYAPTQPLTPHDGDAPRVPWTARLELFEQDFDTAMAIWSVEDAAVGRLCADEQPVTRRRSHLSSSQIEFSQLSDCSQREPSQRTSRSKKRRRTVSEREARDGREAPLPPLSSSTDCTGATQDLDATQVLTMGTVNPTQYDSLTRIAATQEAGEMVQEADGEEREDRTKLMVVPEVVVEVFKTPMSSKRQNSGVKHSNEMFASFSQADVVRESPLEVLRSIHRERPTGQAPDDDDIIINSGFSTGSGNSVKISRKRLREVEESWSEVERSIKPGPTSHLRNESEFLDRTPNALESTRDDVMSLPSIESRRLSFSAIHDQDEVHAESLPTIGFRTGSGKSLRPSGKSLQKYEAFLYGDEIGKSSPLGGPQHVDPDASLHNTGSAHTQPASPLPKFCDVVRDQAGSGTAITGFLTGSGRQVAVSQDRLSQFRRSLYDDNVYGLQSTTAGPAKSSTQDEANISSRSAHPAENVPMAGFQTASGKVVEISEERLKEIEVRLFRDERAAGSCGDHDRRAHSSGASIDSSLPITTRSEPTVEHMNALTAASGFHTASGSRIRVSQERLRDYEQRLLSEDCEAVDAPNSTDAGASCTNISTKTVLSGFSTGNGGRILVSKERFQLYEKMLADEESSDQIASSTVVASENSLHSGGSLVGFSTALGKPVVVSEEKLRLYEDRLANEQGFDPSSRHDGHSATLIQSNDEVIGGFTTGAGRQIALSPQKLSEYQEKMNELEKNTEGSDLPSRRSVERGVHTQEKERETSSVVFSGFSTGSGQRVSVSEQRLREYEAKISEETDNAGSSFSSNDEKEMKTAVNMEMDYSRDASILRTTTQQHEGRPPRIRHSIDAPTSSRTVDLASRRHSLPPRTPVESAPQGGSVSVSTGVIQRMAIANQRNTRPPVLDDVSNTLKSRHRGSGLSGGGKWKAPAQLQSLQSGGYSTPAKTRAAAPQTLSGKKGFRPPVPLKTPPSKSLKITTSPPIKPVEPGKIDQPPTIKMQYREAMRISYKMLMHETVGNSHAFISEARVQMLRGIHPESVFDFVFSRVSGELISRGGENENRGMTVFDFYEEMKECGYIEGATIDWFRNQYRWVVWKLSTLELLSPRFLFGRYVTKSQVMFEMCKRYQRDIVLAQRSILKKILNRDANAATCMILRVAAVLPYPVEEEKDVDLTLPPHWKLSVVLTDGWHGIYAVPDAHLAEALWRHHKLGRLVGKKIVTWSATLQNISDGVDPLESALATEGRWGNPLYAGKDEPSKWPYLKIQVNSTRPVAADARLGLESLVRLSKGKQSDAPYDFVMLKSVPMRSLEVGGGIVRSVCVRVVRISPILHLQSKDFSIGPRILCEEHMPQYFQARQELIQGLRREEENGEEESSSTLPLPVPFVKLEVECAHDEDASTKCYAVLTVWRPGDEMLSRLKEGCKYYVSSLSISWKVNYGHLGVFMRVGTTKGSTFEPLEPPFSQTVHSTGRVCESVEALIQRFRRHSQTMPKEKKLFGDACVVVVRSEDAKVLTTQVQETSSVTSTQHIFVTDMSCRLMSIRIHSTRVFKPSVGKPEVGNLTTRKKTTERFFTRGSKKVWDEGSVICINGLEVSHYDEKLDILDCDLVESSQIISQPSKKSHFFENAQALRAALTQDNKVVDTARESPLSIERLRRHVERHILHLDTACSQNDEDDDRDILHGDEEAEHLTQDLQAVPESDVSYWMSQGHSVYTVGTVVKMLPMNPDDELSIACNVAAVAYIRSKLNPDEEDALQILYLPRKVLEEMQLILGGGLDASNLKCGEDSQKSEPVFRFEAEWETSERLLNSWKPWERDCGATFLLALSVCMSSEDSS